MALTSASCMGGWCDRRAACARHLQPDRSLPIERLCEPGRHEAFESVPTVVAMLMLLQLDERLPDLPARGEP